MKFKVHAKLSLESKIDASHLKQILDPENKTPDNTVIESGVNGNKVITEIRGNMSVRTLLRSIDDIIQTSILSENISTTLIEEDKQDQTE